MDDYKDWFDLNGFHDYVETEPLQNQASPPPPEKPPTHPKPSRNKRRPSTPEPDPKGPVSKVREVLLFLTPMLLALVLAGGLRTFVFTNIRVPTSSMENTIMSGSRLIGSKLVYHFNEPQRYDIAIFEFPDNEELDYVKRIIGLPGEKVQIKNGLVYINDSNVPLRSDFVTTCVPSGNYGPYFVPAGCYFMLGDNRDNSADSRDWINTFVKRDKIIAKVKFSYSPEWKEIK